MRILLALLLGALAVGPARAADPGELRSGSGGGASERPELVLQFGQSRPVEALAFSPDGRLLATGGVGGIIQVWDTTTWTLLWTLPATPGMLTVLRFSPDGKVLGSSGSGSIVQLWNVLTGALDRELTKAEPRPVWMTHGREFLSRDGSVLVTPMPGPPGTPTTLALRTVATGSVLRVLKLPRRAWRFSLSPDCSRLAFVYEVGVQSEQGYLEVWDARTGRRQWQRSIARAAFQPLAFSGDGRWVATAGEPKQVMLWDAGSGRLVRALKGVKSPTKVFAFSPAGTLLAADGRDDALSFVAGEVQVWDLRTGQLTRTLAGQRGGLRPDAFSPDGRLLATTAADGSVKLWDAHTARFLRTFPHCAGPAAFSPDGKRMISGEELRETSSWRLLRRFPGAHGPTIFSADGRRVVSGIVKTTPDGPESYDSAGAKVWDAQTGRVLRTKWGLDLPLCFSPDGTLLVTGGGAPRNSGGSGTVRLWDARILTLLRVLPEAHGPAAALAFSPDSATLAAGNYKGGIRLLDVRSAALRSFLPGVSRSPDALAFAPRGGMLASGSHRYHYPKPGRESGDATPDVTAEVRCWDTGTGQERCLLSGHRGCIRGLAFSPGGGILASGSWDGTLKLWDSASGRLLVTLVLLPLAGHDGISHDWIAFTPEGYYDCSAGALQFLRWRVGDQLLPAAQFEGTHRSPQTIRKALEQAGRSAP